MLRIVIAEDSVLFREGLARLLTESGHEVVDAVGDAPSLLAAVDDQLPDLAIIDVRMPPTMTDDGAQAARALRAQHRIPEDAIVSFTSARIDPIKGHIFQVHAMQHLLAQQPNSKLMVVWAGEGDARAQLETEVRNRKLQGRIRFIGQQSDVMGWLGAADIFTLTSLSEGMPIAIMEAMARELPVVATPVSGIPEELADTGRLLPDPHTNASGVVIELMQHWGELARKRETRIALGRAARARAEQLFRVERMTRAVIDQMQTSINAARAAA